MFESGNIKWFLIFILVIAFYLALFCTSAVMSQADPFMDVQVKLSGISDEEKKILQNLFALLQDIEIIGGKEKAIAQEIEKINQEIKDLEITIAGEEAAFAKKQEGLKQVLKSYQRMGPISYLEIILNSDSLASFLHRINTLRDLTRDTGKLLEQLEASQQKLLGGKTKLTEKLTLFENKQKQSKEALTKKIQLKDEMEEYLASLTEEREHYQNQLIDMQHVWNELKPLFSDTVKNFSSIINDGNLSPDVIKLTFSVFGVKGSINEKVFNDIVSSQTNLENMIFNFQPGKIEIEFPEKNLILSGTFTIIEGHVLKFQAEEGSFYGMSLEPESIGEIFRENQLALDIKPLLGSSTIQSVEIQEDYLNLMIKPNLF